MSAEKPAPNAELERLANAVKECRKSKSIDSCSACEKVLECEDPRKAYRRAVYKSMNGGNSGAFDF
ncbi:MAG: hypothetical protein LBU73_04500 [Helicobacteraceae bacterium]|jgi:hypothetical protein|nr:hypothetical protein [Helicobacteraceae bacterium]